MKKGRIQKRETDIQREIKRIEKMEQEKALRQLATILPNRTDFLVADDVETQTLNILREAINYISVLDYAVQVKNNNSAQNKNNSMNSTQEEKNHSS